MKNRKREIRTSGSVRDEDGQHPHLLGHYRHTPFAVRRLASSTQFDLAKPRCNRSRGMATLGDFDMKPFSVLVAAVALCAATVGDPAHAASDCPNGGTVRFGVEPFEAAAKLIPIYERIGELLSQRLGCKVQMFVTTSYTAEVEAMRAGRLEVGEFSPFSYVLAHQLAKADVVATFSTPEGKPDSYTAGIVTWPGSGIGTLKDVAGHTFGYSDPTSNSGHLFPAYALKRAGIDPDTGVKPLYSGSHTASFEALRNHKVQAAELNSQQIDSSTKAGVYKSGDFVELWRSDPIPVDPIAVRRDLDPAFKARLTLVLQTLDLTSLPTAELRMFGSGHLVPQIDPAYDGIRDLVKVLNIDLSKLGE
jgi:phosphonate transport system substrate-binding protein